MKVDLSQLQQNDSLSIHLSEPVPDEAIPSAGPFEVQAEIIKSGENIIVRGTAEVDERFDCSRCLKPGICRVSASFEAQFTVAEDSEFQEIDLWDDVRQSIILSEPEQPLCKDDCPGICPQCGKDRAEGPCGCREVPQDARLLKLKDFIKKKGNT